jgi:hypothetical protein
VLRRVVKSIDVFLKAHSTKNSPLQYLFDIGVITDIDGHLRYLAARRVLPHLGKGYVLDVGGGTQHFGQLFGEREVETVALNIDLSSLKHSRNIARHDVVADGCHLPFRDCTFSLSLAMAVIHQLQDSKKKQLLSEMQRVSERVILEEECIQQVALTDRVGYWVNAMTGQRTRSNEQRQLDTSTRALASALNENLENVAIRGNRNFAVWLWTTWLLGGTPLVRLFIGLLYYALLKQFDWKPPYYDIIVVCTNLQ